MKGMSVFGDLEFGVVGLSEFFREVGCDFGEFYAWRVVALVD